MSKTIQVWRNVWYAVEQEAYILNFAPKAELQIGLVDRLTSLAEALVSNLLDITSVNSGNVCYSSHILQLDIPAWLSHNVVIMCLGALNVPTARRGEEPRFARFVLLMPRKGSMDWFITLWQVSIILNGCFRRLNSLYSALRCVNFAL